MTRPSSSRLVLAAAAALAVTAAAMRAVIRRRRSPVAAPHARARRPVTCACGQDYVVAGTDRHRIYWLVEGAHEDPVLGHNCPVCRDPLPAEPEPAAV